MKQITAIYLLFILCKVSAQGYFIGVDASRTTYQFLANEISFGKEFNNNSLSMGLKINERVVQHSPTTEIFHLTPMTFSEHFGIALSYKRYFKHENIKIKPFVFLDGDYSRISSRDWLVLPVYDSINNYSTQINLVVVSGPYHVLNCFSGVGLDAPVTDQLDLHLNVGVGFMHQKDTREGSGEPGNYLIGDHFNYGYKASIGLKYLLKKPQ